MENRTRPIEPREFISTHGRPQTRDEIRDWILTQQFPPQGGMEMQIELVECLTEEGLSNIRCQ
jgi:hypothetical protein